MMPRCHRGRFQAVPLRSRKPFTVSRAFHVTRHVFMIVLDLRRSFTEESLGYATLDSCRTFVSPHPDLLARLAPMNPPLTPTAVALRSADLSPLPSAPCESAGCGLKSALQFNHTELNSIAVPLIPRGKGTFATRTNP